ncbi:Carbonyl reductase family member 4 [Paramyrothecium foliicola]|nr:Carbonyl reductase family member 4 [Paramyrothecium foliicola]
MSLRFAGKHCVVVGGTGIIGAHIARAFASQGAVLTVLGRSALQAKPKLQKELPPYQPLAGTKDLPAEHQFVRLDVSQPQTIKDVFTAKSPEDGGVGRMDILVNCAGISQTSFLKRTSDEAMGDIVNTNLMATMLNTGANRQTACIINVSSLMATKGGVGASVYAASKAGVVVDLSCMRSCRWARDADPCLYLGFTRALCREMAPRSIRVNALLPGWVQSPMWDQLKPELKQAYLNDTPLKRVASPAEVADAALFLAANEFANNCVLNLDGGMSAA